MIRPIVPADYPRFAELASQLGYPCTLAEVGPRLDRQAARPHETTLVYEEAGGRVVGWIALRVLDQVYRAPYGDVAGLVVDAACRGRGYGAELLAAAEDWFRAQGLDEVLVRSNALRTEAHRFYDREGYHRAKNQIVFQKPLG